MESILPVHLLQLRWLLSQSETLSNLNRHDVSEIALAWEKENYALSSPEHLAILNSIYNSVKEATRA